MKSSTRTPAEPAEPADPTVTGPAASPATPAATDFARLPLAAATLANLEQLGYLAMTPIQAAALPLALAGHDLIAQAKTGSGKTAAYALALLAKLEPRRFETQAMVLCPTRELADQVTGEIRRLARGEDNIKVLSLCGGVPIRGQVSSLEHGAHVAVGTPGRIMDHLSRGSLKVHALTTLVLDEADRMLDMGFHEDIATVARQCPTSRQTLLFAATYPEGIAKLSRQFLRAPREVKLLSGHCATKIRQRFYEVRETERLHSVSLLLDHYRPVSTLAFCNTKQQCRDLVNVLRGQGFHALELHGDLDQRDRDQVLIQFANRSCSVLVATDVAARGLDILQLEAVINVEIAQDPETHIHRIGRTGRADEEGWAFSLAAMEEMPRLARLEEVQGTECEWHPLASLRPVATAPQMPPLMPPMITIQILGGRKEKIRPGDVLGALTGEAGFDAAQVGKINVTEFSTYVAVDRGIGRQVTSRLSSGRIKGRSVKARLME